MYLGENRPKRLRNFKNLFPVPDRGQIRLKNKSKVLDYQIVQIVNFKFFCH